MSNLTEFIIYLFILLLIVDIVAIICTMYSKDIKDENRNILMPVLSFGSGFLLSSLLSLTMYFALNL